MLSIGSRLALEGWWATYGVSAEPDRKGNACPPEDCGGPPGYAELLEVLANPTHEEHERLLRWVGRPFDPTEFDVVAVNVALQHLR